MMLRLVSGEDGCTSEIAGGGTYRGSGDGDGEEGMYVLAAGDSTDRLTLWADMFLAK
jgi:hypothetical protein